MSPVPHFRYISILGVSLLIGVVSCARLEMNGSQAHQAKAAAVLRVLEKTMDLEQMVTETGAIFITPASDMTMHILEGKIQSPAPRLDSDLTKFDGNAYRDKLTGKDAMLLRVQLMSSSRHLRKFRVCKSYGSLGGNEYYITVELEQGVWKVTRFEHGYVS